jgi:hypothetical protein
MRPSLCFSAALLSAGCSGGPAGEPYVLDCNVEDDYEFRTVYVFEDVQEPYCPEAELNPDTLLPIRTAMTNWYGYGDTSPGYQRCNEPAAMRIPEGPRCGSEGALRLLALGHKDWGAGFGEWGVAAPSEAGGFSESSIPIEDDPTTTDVETSAGQGIDASSYDGVSFWARSAGEHMARGFMVTIQDRKTHPNGQVCFEAGEEEIEAGTHTMNEAGMTVRIGVALPSPDECGNGYQAIVRTYTDWTLHTIPFDTFRQAAQPNSIPEGIDRTGILQFTFNIPKDSNIDLWIDDLGFYRRRAAEPAGMTE